MLLLVVMQKIAMTMLDIFALKSYLHGKHDVQWSFDLVAVEKHLQFLQESLNNSTASLDQSTNKALEVWGVAEEEDLPVLKSTVITQATSWLDFLSLLIAHSTAAVPLTPSTDALLLSHNIQYRAFHHLSADEVKQMVIFLLRWISAPQYEVVLSVIQVIGQFAGESWSSVFPPTLLLLLTNGLINRLRAPAAFTVNTFTAFSDARKYTKQDNLKISSLLVQDACFNAVLDLHSSDSLLFHEIYSKLRLNEVLHQEKEAFRTKLMESAGLLQESDQEKVHETIDNIEAFLAYKSSNFTK